MKYLALLSVFLLFSCTDDKDDNAPCTGPEVAGIDVFVRDAATNDVLTDGVTVKVSAGSFQADLDETDGHFLGLYDQQGSYVLTVSKAGYQTYTENQVGVYKPGCHSITTDRTVNLQPN